MELGYGIGNMGSPRRSRPAVRGDWDMAYGIGTMGLRGLDPKGTQTWGEGMGEAGNGTGGELGLGSKLGLREPGTWGIWDSVQGELGLGEELGLGWNPGIGAIPGILGHPENGGICGLGAKYRVEELHEGENPP